MKHYIIMKHKGNSIYEVLNPNDELEEFTEEQLIDIALDKHCCIDNAQLAYPANKRPGDRVEKDDIKLMSLYGTTYGTLYITSDLIKHIYNKLDINYTDLEAIIFRKIDSEYIAKCNILGMDVIQVDNVYINTYKLKNENTLEILTTNNQIRFKNKHNDFIFNYFSARTIDLTEVNLTNLQSMDHMFEQLPALRTVKLNGKQLKNLVSMECAFRMSGIDNLNMSDWDLSNISNVQFAFYDCSKLKEINFGAHPELDSHGIFDITKMCNDSELLDSIHKQCPKCMIFQFGHRG